MLRKLQTQYFEQKDVKSPAKDEYVLLSPKVSSFPEKNDPKGELVKMGIQNVQGSAPLHQAISSMVSSPDAIAILRAELLKERTKYKSTINEYKHFYQSNTYTVSTTESSEPIFNPTQGTGISNRLTNATRLKRVVVRVRCQRTPAAQSTAAITSPVVTVVIGRTKVPASLGAVPTVFNVGTNPPSNSNTIYDGLGVSTDPQLMVVNPNVVDMYHIYRKHHIKFNDEGIAMASSGVGTVPYQVHHSEFEIPLHELESSFVSNTSQYSVINQLWISVRSDIPYSNMGFADNFYWTMDFEFRDVQD